MTAENQIPEPAGPATIYRILDANRNRCLEGLRVVEEHVRFIWEDQHLVAQCKQLRHDLVTVLASLPRAELQAARDVLADVGTSVTTHSEYERADVDSVVAANWSRVQQSLRSLEEYLKVLAPAAAAQLEVLRYRSYTIERAVTVLSASRDRLAAARLYVLVDGRASLGVFRQLIERLVQGGADMLQLRDKTLSDRALLKRARVLREITREHGVLFIMNDRADLAALAQADGVHLGQDDVAVKDARGVVGARALVGVSTHNLDQARQAVLEGANYLGCGPTFPSVTKEFTQFPGVEFLREVHREIRLPAFAIGGINSAHIDRVLAAGFARVAVSNSVVNAADPAEATRALKSRLLTAT
ncbi:MAG: thiamine phosphate synthase [Planctomycetaceae bacterium]|nr:thiamine phosphate synthase [Planctomycetaceae bacterium]